MKKLLQRAKEWVESLPILDKKKYATNSNRAEVVERSRKLLLSELRRYRIQHRAKVYQVRGHSNSWRVEVDSFPHAYNLFSSLQETFEHQVKHTTRHSYYSCRMGCNSNVVFTDRVRKSSKDVAILYQTSTIDNTTILVVHFSLRR